MNQSLSGFLYQHNLAEMQSSHTCQTCHSLPPELRVTTHWYRTYPLYLKLHCGIHNDIRDSFRQSLMTLRATHQPKTTTMLKISKYSDLIYANQHACLNKAMRMRCLQKVTTYLVLHPYASYTVTSSSTKPLLSCTCCRVCCTQPG